MIKNNRIEVIDSLRGFALFGILLIHGVEHFNFFYKPNHYFLFSPSFDREIMEATFFMVSQKAYSIFALMFGVSFHIQMTNQKNSTGNFNLRFAWRLTILMLMGIVHSLFYNGDILFVYAVLGFLLIPFNWLNTRILWILAILFALQLPFIVVFIRPFFDAAYEYSMLQPLISVRDLTHVYVNGDFVEVIKTNIVKGKSRSIIWSYNTGRLYQLVFLFILGIILVRNNFFGNLGKTKRNNVIALIISIVLCIVFWFWIKNISDYNLSEIQKRLLRIIVRSYYNLSFTTGLISIFLLLYIVIPAGKIFKHFTVYGRLSLTNYLSQTIIGVLFFYGYGLAMYKYMGHTWGIIYSLLFSVLQISFSHYWLMRYRYGPLEWIWRALTYFDFKLKNKKQLPKIE